MDMNDISTLMKRQPCPLRTQEGQVKLLIVTDLSVVAFLHNYCSIFQPLLGYPNPIVFSRSTLACLIQKQTGRK